LKLYRLPADLREELKKPLGKLVRNESISSLRGLIEGAKLVITVGDETLDTVLRLGITPDVFVVDGRVMRRVASLKRPRPRFSIAVKNPPGTISSESILAVELSLELGKEVGVLVDGEEDLLTLPYILLSPPGSVILYGQPGEGIVVVDSSDKERARLAMERMGWREKGLKSP